MKIYTPPIITGKDQITYGHGVNLVFCDTFARITELRGNIPELLLPCWNNNGLRSEKIAKSQLTIEKDVSELESKLNAELKYFGLKDYQYYRDNSEVSKNICQKAFTQLLNNGFIKKRENKDYVLLIPEIIKRTNLLSFFEEITFWPKAGMKEKLKDLISEINGEYALSKIRHFATQIPGEDDNTLKINPLFDLAVSPLILSDKTIDYSIDGSRTFLHGTFLPYLVWAALKDTPFSKNVYVHGYSKLSSDLKVLPLKELAKEFGTDVLRFALLTQAGRLEDKIHDRGLFQKGKIVRNKLTNIAKLFYLKNVNLDISSLPLEELNKFESENVSTLMEYICSESVELSSDLSKNSLPRHCYVDRYKKLATLVFPVMPMTMSEVKNILSGN